MFHVNNAESRLNREKKKKKKNKAERRKTSVSSKELF